MLGRGNGMLRDEIYALCVRNNWFTCGTAEQYERMFRMVELGYSARDVAMVIWFCSAGVGFNSVYEKIRKAYRKCKDEYYTREVLQ